jgi:hypothetical protein
VTRRAFVLLALFLGGAPSARADDSHVVIVVGLCCDLIFVV